MSSRLSEENAEHKGDKGWHNNEKLHGDVDRESDYLNICFNACH